MGVGRQRASPGTRTLDRRRSCCRSPAERMHVSDALQDSELHFVQTDILFVPETFYSTLTVRSQEDRVIARGERVRKRRERVSSPGRVALVERKAVVAVQRAPERFALLVPPEPCPTHPPTSPTV
eukprot:2239984-Rhodomonas_salina.1